ncbi:MAG TPA: EpsI family protein [Fimbriimonadaceae bacterium]|nr:EpsI family protein [Fimbriimonadaceae bacterium]
MNLLRTINGRLILTAMLLAPATYFAFSTTVANHANVVIETETLPERVAEWTGESVELSDTEKSILHSPAASQRLYSRPNGDQVQVLVIQVDNTQNAHDPRLCMNGSGFRETESEIISAPWADAHEDAEISHSVFTKDNRSQHMYYWMSTSEGTIANMSTGLKLEGILRALKGQPTKGIAVRVLGLENRFDPNRTTEPEVLQELWSQIREDVQFEKLIARQ